MDDTQFVSALAVVIFASALIAALLRSAPRAEPPEIEPLDFTGAARRKRDAKRFNEHAKLASTFLNNLGIATVVTVAVAPAVQAKGDIEWPRTFMALSAALVLHILGQLTLRLWKSEE